MLGLFCSFTYHLEGDFDDGRSNSSGNNSNSSNSSSNTKATAKPTAMVAVRSWRMWWPAAAARCAWCPGTCTLGPAPMASWCSSRVPRRWAGIISRSSGRRGSEFSRVGEFWEVLPRFPADCFFCLFVFGGGRPLRKTPAQEGGPFLSMATEGLG